MKHSPILLRRAEALLLICALVAAALPASAAAISATEEPQILTQDIVSEMPAETLSEAYQRLLGEMTALGSGEPTFAYKGENYPIFTGIDIANNTFWDTDDYYPFCDAYLAGYKAYGEKMGAVFLQYVAVLNEIAVRKGYQNYREYADRVLYQYDFDTDAVWDIVSGNYKRSLPMLIDFPQFEIYVNEQVSLPQEAFTAGLIARYGEISPDYSVILEALVESDRFTVEKTNRSLAHGSVLNAGKQSTLYVGYFADPNFASTLTHEMGHYLHEYQLEEGDASYAIKETHSTGGVLLCADYAEAAFKETFDEPWAALYMIDYLAIELAPLQSGAIMYKFFSGVFEHPENYTSASLGEKYLELMLSIGHDGGYSPAYQMLVGCEWCKDLSILKAPLYALSYCLASCNALKLWRDQELYGTGEETYVRLVNTATPRDEPYSDFCQRMGILDFFAPGAHEGLDDFLADKLSAYYRTAFGE